MHVPSALSGRTEYDGQAGFTIDDEDTREVDDALKSDPEIGTVILRDLQFLKDTWRAQFENHPDFKIRSDRVIGEGQCVGVFGFSEGTYSPDGVMREENHWEVPAAFLGIVMIASVPE